MFGEKLKPGEKTVSKHALRRTARRAAARLEEQEVGNNYVVRSALRGPLFWRVVERPASKKNSTPTATK